MVPPVSPRRTKLVVPQLESAQFLSIPHIYISSFSRNRQAYIPNNGWCKLYGWTHVSRNASSAFARFDRPPAEIQRRREYATQMPERRGRILASKEWPYWPKDWATSQVTCEGHGPWIRKTQCARSPSHTHDATAISILSLSVNEHGRRRLQTHIRARWRPQSPNDEGSTAVAHVRSLA